MSRPDDPEAIARAERLAAALRANLKRRKAQSRGRQSLAEAEGKPEAPDSATGAPVDKVERGEG